MRSLWNGSDICSFNSRVHNSQRLNTFHTPSRLRPGNKDSAPKAQGKRRARSAGAVSRTQELHGSPKRREQHMAMMQELLEKMRDLTSKMTETEEEPSWRPREPPAEPQARLRISEPADVRVRRPRVYEPVAEVPRLRISEPADVRRGSEPVARAFQPEPRARAEPYEKWRSHVLDNLTIPARIARQLAEKLRHRVTLLGEHIEDLGSFLEVADGHEPIRGSLHFSPGRLDRFELQAAFQRLDIFATPRDVDQLLSSPAALHELEEVLQQALDGRRRRLYKATPQGPSLSPPLIAALGSKVAPPFAPRIG
ncbi:unnamed protein product [Effrenium voratum]|uniref:Uncharacterized protein n=1 Tax=Effrenium voratum TaxID=2562239 RepID=A0AA36J6A0_9DINO|nr:unnamed protein product [Effrenium voratum]